MSQTLDNLSYTWNNAGTTFTGIKYNVTDTASASDSTLMDLQVGGVSKFRVTKAGVVNIGSTLTQISGSTQSLILGNGSYSYLVGDYSASAVAINGALFFGFYTGTGGLAAPGQVIDTRLYRDAADTLAQRRSTNAQEFRLYNTYTDASNYERAKFKWDTNVLKIGTEAAGTGTARSFDFVVGGTSVIQLLSSASNVTGTRLYTPANGKLAVMTSGNGAGTLCFGLGTSSFAEIMGNGTKLEVRLGNDGALTNIQGKLTTDANAVAETPTATHTLTIYDAAGTAYKVLAVAA